MGFDEGISARFRRYREAADATLREVRAAEEAARKLSVRLFDGLERGSRYAREAGFGVETERGRDRFGLRVAAGEGATARATFALLGGAAAETDEFLMHEELSGHTLRPGGYSGRVVGWASPGVPEEPCQVFAVYRDGTWRTKGLLVERSRGSLDDPDEVTLGFCLRILGRLVDLCAPTEGAGRVWEKGPYTLEDHAAGRPHPTRTRWLK